MAGNCTMPRWNRSNCGSFPAPDTSRRCGKPPSATGWSRICARRSEHAHKALSAAPPGAERHSCRRAALADRKLRVPPGDRVPAVGHPAFDREFAGRRRAVLAVLLRLERGADRHHADEPAAFEPAAEHRPVRVLPADAIGSAAGLDQHDLDRVFGGARFVPAEAVAPPPSVEKILLALLESNLYG